jgi:hypothetical protein
MLPTSLPLIPTPTPFSLPPTPLWHLGSIVPSQKRSPFGCEEFVAFAWICSGRHASLPLYLIAHTPAWSQVLTEQ